MACHLASLVFRGGHVICSRVHHVGHQPNGPGGPWLRARLPRDCAAGGDRALALSLNAMGSRRGTMIQPLRRLHFRIWLVLPVIFAVLFGAGLLVRRSTMPANAHIRWET